MTKIITITKEGVVAAVVLAGLVFLAAPHGAHAAVSKERRLPRIASMSMPASPVVTFQNGGTSSGSGGAGGAGGDGGLVRTGDVVSTTQTGNTVNSTVVRIGR